MQSLHGLFNRSIVVEAVACKIGTRKTQGPEIKREYMFALQEVDIIQLKTFQGVLDTFEDVLLMSLNSQSDELDKRLH